MQGFQGIQGMQGPPGGGSGLIGRQSFSITTPPLSSGVSESTTIVGYKGYALLTVQVSTSAWVTVYSNNSSRTLDSGRLKTSDPAPDSGVIAEVITTQSGIVAFAPGIIGFNNEITPTNDIPLKISNNGTVTAPITVMLTLLKLEE
jgi:hypothetical protein